MYAAGEPGGPSVYFEVDDIEAAVAKIRELGGTAEEIEQIQSGFMASCEDDQGSRFNLWQGH